MNLTTEEDKWQDQRNHLSGMKSPDLVKNVLVCIFMKSKLRVTRKEIKRPKQKKKKKESSKCLDFQEGSGDDLGWEKLKWGHLVSATSWEKDKGPSWNERNTSRL